MQKSFSEESNDIIIKQLLRGDSGNFDLLVLRQQPGLLHYASGFSSDSKLVREISKKVLKEGFRNLHKLQGNSLFSSYLVGLLRKECRARDLSANIGSESPFWTGLAKLSRVQREVVFLFFQGYSLEEIAMIRRDSPGLARSRFSRGLINLRNKIYFDPDISEKIKCKVEVQTSCETIHLEQMFLARAASLKEKDKELFNQHIKGCEICKNNWNKVGGFFKLLKGEILPFTENPPLLKHFPGISPVWVVLSIAGIFALTLIAFFLFKAAFFGEVKELVK